MKNNDQLIGWLDGQMHQNRLHLINPDGSHEVLGRCGRVVDWRLKKKGVLQKILRNPQMNLGETYIRGDWDVDGHQALYELLYALRQNFEPNLHQPLAKLALRAVQASLRSRNSLHVSKRNVAHHYNLDEPLFRAMLGEDMHYSCAYFQSTYDTLEDAQGYKCEHIARKLRLRPGQHVLDIGSGWGSLAIFLARNCGVRVTGITLSEEQERVASERAAEAGLSDQVQFCLQDYREHHEQYDRIVSVGMFEHVGRKHYDSFFESVLQNLTSDGVALLHTIGTLNAPGQVNPWIQKYIFLGGHIPALSEVAQAIEHAGVTVHDVEILHQHYAWTLREWADRFAFNREKFAEAKGERFCRVWEFYLAVCRTAFEIGGLAVQQWQLSKGGDGVPATRGYLYGKRGNLTVD